MAEKKIKKGVRSLNNKNKFLSIFLTLIIVIQLTTISTQAVEVQHNTTVGESLSLSSALLQKFKSSFKSPDNQPIYAYSKIQYNTKFLAYDQAQIALDYLSLAEEAENSSLISLKNQYISDAMATLKFMTTYLVNSRIRDKNGIIEFWDTSLEDKGLTRVSKVARDQALTLLALDKLLTFFDKGYSVDYPTLVFYNESFAHTWTFLKSLYDTTNGGWYAKTTPINESTFSIDTTKRTADNMIIISSLAQIKHISFLEKGFTKNDLKSMLFKTMNFFLTKFTVPNKGIASFGNANGLFVSNSTFFAKENALYGLANLKLFELTGNSTFKNQAIYIWSFLKTDFWENFGGLLIGITIEGDPTMLSKTVEDQIWFADLSLQLATLNPINSTYIAYYLKMFVLIKHNFIQNNNIASSTDYRFNPSSEFYCRSATYYVDFLINSPHISAISVSKSIIIGSKLPVKIYLSSFRNLGTNISVSSSNHFNPISLRVNSSVIETNFGYQNSVQSGSQKLEFNMTISQSLVQQLYIETYLKPNVRIPNGVIYLIGAGILASMVVLVRRPPEFIKKYIQEIKFDRQSSEVLEPSTERNE